jgi:hypothetical protein
MSAEARRPKPLNPIADCATLAGAPASIELEDANADPDPSGFCGALRLQRQSGDQSLRTSEPLRERSQLQSLQSLQLRAEQRRHRPLRAGGATKAGGLACHGAADAAPRVAADDALEDVPYFILYPSINSTGSSTRNAQRPITWFQSATYIYIRWNSVGRSILL